MTNCPCCGQVAPALPLRVDLDENVAYAGGTAVRLSEFEADFLDCLAHHAPKSVSHDQIMDWLYGLALDNDPDPNIVKVWACKVRRKIQPLGFRVKTVWGHGYKLEQA